MGCASSSPLINGGGPGGIVESAKETATKTANDVLHAGESAIHGELFWGDLGEIRREIRNGSKHNNDNGRKKRGGNLHWEETVC